MSTQFQLNLAPERKVWSVSEFTARVRELLASEFPDLWVEGEVSNCHQAQSGHLYFTLKDARAQIEASRDYIFSKANIPQNLFSSQ